TDGASLDEGGTVSEDMKDDFVKTILELCSRERYTLVGDFGWYLLTLVKCAAKVSTRDVTSREIARQFMDICDGVEQVRGYGVTLACSLLNSAVASDVHSLETPEPNSDEEREKERNWVLSCPHFLRCCMWVVGKYLYRARATSTKDDNQSDVDPTRAIIELSRTRPDLTLDGIWAALHIAANAKASANPNATDQISCLYEQTLPALRALAREHRCALDVSLESESELITYVMDALVAADAGLAEKLLPAAEHQPEPPKLVEIDLTTPLISLPPEMLTDDKTSTFGARGDYTLVDGTRWVRRQASVAHGVASHRMDSQSHLSTSSEYSSRRTSPTLEASLRACPSRTDPLADLPQAPKNITYTMSR
ncbi:hypothetical protein FOZ62_025792, partial [Perkinsus olseni]